MVERGESRFPDAVLGDTRSVTSYCAYRDFAGVKFPTRIEQSQGGFPVLDVTIKEVQPNAPDRFAQSGKKARIQGVKNKLVMKDSTRTIEIRRNVDSVHNNTFLMVYLPKEKLLIEADAYTPLPPNTPPPALANANNVNLIANIEGQKLAVERILPLHGRVVPVTELYATAKATMPK